MTPAEDLKQALGLSKWLRLQSRHSTRGRISQSPGAEERLLSPMRYMNRIAYWRSTLKWLKTLKTAELDAIEISGKAFSIGGFKTFRSFHYPENDICKGPLREEDGSVAKADIIFADQVWEHLARPYAGIRHVRENLREGGVFWLSVHSSRDIILALSTVRGGAQWGSRTC